MNVQIAGESAPEQRLRVLEFVTVFAIGGIERQLMTLVQHLDPKAVELHMACFRRWGSFLAEFEARGVPISEYPIDRLVGRRALMQQLRLAMYLRRQRIHVLQTHGFYPNVFGMLAGWLAGTPVRIASMHDQGHDLSAPRRALQRFACSFAHRVVVNAEAIKGRLIDEGYAAERISVIHNGIDVTRLAPNTPPGALRARLGVAPGAPIVAVIARLDPVKSIETFLDAARIVADRFPEARFVIAGDDGTDGSYRERLRERCGRLGLADRVIFSGFVLDVGALLAEVAVSVLPSISEGLSNTLLESQAAGVPVVATRVGGNAEAVVDGVTGLLVRPRDPRAMAECITQILGDRELATRFGAAGKRRVADLFSVEQMVRRRANLWTHMWSAIK